MAPSLPFRKRTALRKATKTARNVALADAAWALARDRLLTKVPGVQPRRRRPGVKVLAAAGAATAVVVAVLIKGRRRVACALPGRSTSGAPGSTDTVPPPQPANYDAPGPVANPATPIPAPDPLVRPGRIDEQAEVDAAAAEARNIGGGPTAYAGLEPDRAATPEEAPLMEAGEGEAEGQEQAEAGLADAAAPLDAGMTDTERQIEDAIEQAGNPLAGERPEPLPPVDEPAGDAERRAREAEGDSPGAGEPGTWSGRGRGT
jgi:hypothetical protein